MAKSSSLPNRSPDPHFEVVALSGHEWRGCDPVDEEGDSMRVLGHMARDAREYAPLALPPALEPAPVVCGCFRDEGRFAIPDDVVWASCAIAAAVEGECG